MEFKELTEIIKKIKKGTFIKIGYKTDKKPLAAFKDSTIEKVSNGVYRLGISFSNMKQNINRVTGPLPWGQWMAGYEGYIVEHKDKKYLRVYIDSVHHTTSKWLLNGVETTEDYLVDNKIIGKQNHTPLNGCFVIPVDGIISIGA